MHGAAASLCQAGLSIVESRRLHSVECYSDTSTYSAVWKLNW